MDETQSLIHPAAISLPPTLQIHIPVQVPMPPA